MRRDHQLGPQCGGDPATIVDRARELVSVLHELEERDDNPATLRPVPHVALNDHQVGLVHALMLLALVQKTESTVDRPGEPRYGDVRDRWLACTGEGLEEVGARLAELRGSRLGEGSGQGGIGGEVAAALRDQGAPQGLGLLDRRPSSWASSTRPGRWPRPSAGCRAPSRPAR